MMCGSNSNSPNFCSIIEKPDFYKISSARPLRAWIDLNAIVQNYRYSKKLTPNARAFAVIKANAYGHGAINVARALASEADGFAVACIAEALELRESGIQNPILLLEGVFTPEEIAFADQADLALVIHSQEQLNWILTAQPEKQLNCWIKIDSGMHRLGFAPEVWIAVYQQLINCPHVKTIVAMTHFARADEWENLYTEQQFKLFAATIDNISVDTSLANSAAILAWPHAQGTWTRPGLMLYGASPFSTFHPQAKYLIPAMTLESALIAIHELAPGEPIGYGGRFCCTRKTRVGVAAVGYADGYPRHAPDGTPIAVNGQRTRIIGRVSMDMLTLDLTDLPTAQIGDRVELWGKLISVNEVAQASATIPYQLFTGVSRRVNLRYVN